MDETQTHTTKHEFLFIDGLGTHSELRMDKVQLMRGYLAGARKRTDWGDVNCKAVIEHVTEWLLK